MIPKPTINGKIKTEETVLYSGFNGGNAKVTNITIVNNSTTDNASLSLYIKTSNGNMLLLPESFVLGMEDTLIWNNGYIMSSGINSAICAISDIEDLTFHLYREEEK